MCLSLNLLPPVRNPLGFLRNSCLMSLKYVSFWSHTGYASYYCSQEKCCYRLNTEGATYARDTFSNLIYESLFKWTIARVNNAMSNRNVDGESASFIGILDIFGFEFFAKNSFEQLCINYTNEKLQDHFSDAIFRVNRKYISWRV
jgi:myosin heavy subunit